MAPRELPGFYFDPEKNKYFKIQPNHIATNAKYSQANVNRENEAKEEIKIEEKRRKLRHVQTIKRSKVLQHPLFGSGLNRELGLRQSFATYSHQSYKGLLNQENHCSTSSYIGRSDRTILDAIYDPNLRGMLLSLCLRKSNEIGLWRDKWPLAYNQTTRNLDDGFVNLVQLRKPVTMLATTSSGTDEGTTFLALCGWHAVGNAFLGTVAPKPSHDIRGEYLHLGHYDAPWSCARGPEPWLFASSGCDSLAAINKEGVIAAEHDITTESRDVAWLDHQTVIYGQHEREGSGGICLWDLRSKDTSFRFDRPHPLTGIRSLNNKTQCVVADNYQMALYDTRAGRTPLRTIPHLHEGPQSSFDLAEGMMVAAIDRYGCFQMYSLQTGRQVIKTPHTAPMAMPAVHHLRYAESPKGAHFVGSLFNHVTHWPMVQAEDDSEAESDGDSAAKTDDVVDNTDNEYSNPIDGVEPIDDYDWSHEDDSDDDVDESDESDE